jgi:hypothetical protein
MAMKTSSYKAKGRRLQQWICKQISEITGIDYDQHNDQSLIHSREMGQTGTDIILRGRAQQLFPFSVECKNTESLSLYSAIDQAKSNATDKTAWMVVHKKNNSEPIVIMSWQTFQKWYSKKRYLL